MSRDLHAAHDVGSADVRHPGRPLSRAVVLDRHQLDVDLVLPASG